MGIIPEGIRAPLRKNPNSILIYGMPKVGKSFMMTSLKDALILDLETGYDAYSGAIARIENLEALAAARQEIIALHEKGQFPYKFIVLDTVDILADWIEADTCHTYRVSSIVDLAYGKGSGIVRERVINLIKSLKALCYCLVVVGHIKSKEYNTDTGAVLSPETLDLPGRLKGMIMSAVDVCAVAHRENDEQQLMLSFRNEGGKSVAGGRYQHLINQNIAWKWEDIFRDYEEI